MIKLIKNTFFNEKETKEKLCRFIMNSEKLSMGDKCREFEEKFSEYQGREYSVLYNSGSSANLAVIQSSLNLGLLNEGDKVGFSALTWATNVMPLVQLGLRPVPIDVSFKNLNVNSWNLLGLKEDLNALFITNLLGFCGDLDKIKEICDEKRITLIEDNCESLESRLKGKKLGNFGLASTFSFFVGHHLSTIEGGMACTDDEELYNMLIMVRAHGWGRNLNSGFREKLREEHGIDDFYENYAFYTLGYNLRPTEITGFLGCEQIKYLEEMCDKRNKNFLDFYESTKNNDRLHKLDLDHMDFVSNFSFPLVFKDEKESHLSREKFRKIAETRPIVGGNMVCQPFFKKCPKELGKRYSLPNSEEIHSNGFYFPNNPELTFDEKKKIIDLLNGKMYS